jgi:hypothetical protein
MVGERLACLGDFFERAAAFCGARPTPNSAVVSSSFVVATASRAASRALL